METGSVEGTLSATLQVLLAEDNPVNQTVISAFLRKPGHEVTVASSGKEALAAWECKDFDVVLMDIEMPDMDGLEVTGRIREMESNGCHVPIIAMTAHAMKGDKERFLAAGMDGFIAKPVCARTLLVTIEKVLFGRAEGDESKPATSGLATKLPGIAAPVFDWPQLLGRVSGNVDLGRLVAEQFLVDIPGYVHDLASALRSGVCDTIGRHAHRIKGTASTVSAERLRSLAMAIEKQASNSRICDPGTLETELMAALDEVLTRIREVLDNEIERQHE